MSDLEVEEFVEKEDLSIEDLERLSKADLRKVAAHLGVKVPTAARKDKLFEAVCAQLDLSSKTTETAVMGNAELELQKFKMQMEFEERLK